MNAYRVYAPLVAACLAALLLLVQAVAPAGAAVRFDKEVSGRNVIVVVPDRQSGAVPLLVLLHGCDQSAAEFLAVTRLEELVDSRGFALAVPESRAGGDNPLGCWRWWDPGNQRRDGDDPRHIVEIIRSMDVQVDNRRIYTLGLSSGGAMAMILATVYPEVFAAVGVHSGVGFAAAANTACALKVLDRSPEDPEARGELAYRHRAFQRVVPAMIVHGGADTVVEPAHAGALVREIAQTNDLVDDALDNDSFAAEPDATIEDGGPCGAADGACYEHEAQRFADGQGNVVLERVLVDGLGHAWSGGQPGHRYSDPRGPDAAAMFWRFFEAHQIDPASLREAARPECSDWWAPPWWHYMWAGTMSFSEYACDLNPWSMVWRHQIEGVSGPGRCP